MNDFFQDIRRFEVTKDYNHAFMLCMENLSNMAVRENAQNEMRRLMKKYTYNVFEEGYGSYRLKINKVLNENWLLDLAIANNYNSIEREYLSTGWFSSVPCITIGSFLAKHKYGWSIDKEKGTTTIYYKCSTFCDDFKMLNSICEELIKMF